MRAIMHLLHRLLLSLGQPLSKSNTPKPVCTLRPPEVQLLQRCVWLEALCYCCCAAPLQL
jgi:hypothetical protein